MGKVAKLVMVTEDNNNKYYNMTEENGQILIERGRIDVTAIKEKPVSISKWNSLYNSKVKKGYVDQTHLFIDENQPVTPGQKDSSPSFADITDPLINKFITQLQSWANKSVEQNYTISTSKVTQKQIDAAQTILNDLSHLINIGVDIHDLNEMLLNLFKTLPRKMSHVQDYLIHTINDKKSLDDAMDRITHEQDLLDTMKGQVQVYAAQQKQSVSTGVKNQTLLEAMGLEFFNLSPQEKDIIFSKIQKREHKDIFKQGFHVNNVKTRKRFEEFVKNAENKKMELFFHGSRSENWFSILESGLMLRPTNAVINGKMYGFGNYYSDVFAKSLGYTSYNGARWTGGNSNSAILSLYDVHVGNQLKVTKWDHKHTSLNEKGLKQIGKYDSIFAPGGYDCINNEFIVYNEAQSTIKYIMQFGK
jgi:poly [ADP-ribose] polymerase